MLLNNSEYTKKDILTVESKDCFKGLKKYFIQLKTFLNKTF